MKKVYCLLLCVIGFNANLLAQSKMLLQADAHYQSFQYTKALPQYKQCAKNGEAPYYTARQTALCHLSLNQPREAEEWLRKARGAAGAGPEIHLLLAKTLFANQKNGEAMGILEEYCQSNSQLLKNFTDYADYLRSLDADSSRYSILPLGINTPYSEHSAVWNETGILFSSNRPYRGLMRHREQNRNQSFYNLYRARRQPDGGFKVDPKPLIDDKKGIHYSSLTYHEPTKIAYVTQNQIGPSKKAAPLTIYSYLVTDLAQWDKNLGQLPFSSSQYAIAHPAIGSDGKIFYFASDMPGGFGGMDLYTCEMRNGFLSTPQNMGPSVNTPGNELFPVIAPNHHLMFSSDGHPGKGGLDIWVAILHEGSVIQLFNPGKPINSNADDFGLALNEEMDEGIFTSNRPGGKGNDDLYAVRLNAPFAFTLIRGNVHEAVSGTGLGEVLVQAVNSNGTVVSEATSDAQGNFQIVLRSNQSYEIVLTKRLVGRKTKFISQPDLTNQKEYQLSVEF